MSFKAAYQCCNYPSKTALDIVCGTHAQKAGSGYYLIVLGNVQMASAFNNFVTLVEALTGRHH